jgi:hypothetical protein
MAAQTERTSVGRNSVLPSFSITPTHSNRVGEINMRKVALLIFVFACYVIVNDPAHLYTDSPVPTAVTSVTSVTPDNTPGNNIFNENATLDNSQITYSDDTPVILPSDATTVTPCILLNGTYVPEESPDGGYPIGWLDNSPTYSDGWTLLVDDSTSPPVISWRAPEGY